VTAKPARPRSSLDDAWLARHPTTTAFTELQQIRIRVDWAVPAREARWREDGGE
jgi:hypothetical protein